MAQQQQQQRASEALLLFALLVCFGFTIMISMPANYFPTAISDRFPGKVNNDLAMSAIDSGVGGDGDAERKIKPSSTGAFTIMDEEPLPSGFTRSSANIHVGSDVSHLWKRLLVSVQQLKGQSESRMLHQVNDGAWPPPAQLEQQAKALKALGENIYWKDAIVGESLKKKQDIIVGILSARNHSELRNAQRETWVKFVKKHPDYKDRVLVRFVIGDEPCRVPEEDRIDKYSCEPAPIVQPVLGEEHQSIHFPTSIDSGARYFSGPLGIDFRMNLWTVVTHLGVYDWKRDGLRHDITAKLWDTDNKAVLRSAVFTPKKSGELVGNARYLPVEPLLLPKGFRGTITAEGYSIDEQLYPSLGPNSFDTGGGILSILPGTRSSFEQGTFPETKDCNDGTTYDAGGGTFMYRTDNKAPNVMLTVEWKPGISYAPVDIAVGDVVRFQKTDGVFSISQCGSQDIYHSCEQCNVVSPPLKDDYDFAGRTSGKYFFTNAENCRSGMKVIVNVSPRVGVLEGLQAEKVARKERHTQYNLQLQREESKLKTERQIHKDIVLLPSFVDTYRRLPLKLLELYRWAAQFDFNFLIKTDDDSFIDLARVLRGLEERRLTGRKKIWWSRFRTNWPLDKTGKWRESEYTSPVYPAFACGAGNVLSSDLVHWLASNREHLKPYQGEDVSVGIWLAAVYPTIINDINWRCFGQCDKERDNGAMFNLPEQSPEGLRSLWRNLTRCGHPCACE